MKPYCRFKHGRMIKSRGKFSKRDGGKRQYYHCRNDYCSYTALAPRDPVLQFADTSDEDHLS